MELKLQPYKLPDKIDFNFEELKQEIAAKVELYKTLVYTDEQIVDAKKDKANLNKLKKALNDERIRMEKEYMIPFNIFKAEINEIIKIIDEPIMIIDKQVKEAEEKKRTDKLDEILNYWNSCTPPFPIKYEMIHDPKWLNATVSMKSIKTQIDELLAKIDSDLATLENLPEFSFEAKEVYKTTLNLAQAIQEGQRLAQIQKKKQEEERLKAERELAKQINPPVEEFIPPVVDKELEEKAFGEPQRKWIGFKAHMTVEQAGQLKNFFECRGIEFERIVI